MESTQTESAPVADISFMVVLNGKTCVPVLVRRESFIRKVGRNAARKTYQVAYAPRDILGSTFVGSGDVL